MDNELYHYQIKGAKHGQRRWQYPDGSLTPAGKIRYRKMRKAQKTLEKAQKKFEKKQTRGSRKEVDNAQKEVEKLETYEERKARVIKSGSAKDVLEFKGDLTPEERKSIKDRLEWDRDISKMVPAEVSKGKQYADKIAGIAEDAVGYAKTGIKVWNTAANVINAFSPSEVPLPRINTNIDADNWKERHEARNKYKKELAEKEAKEAKEAKEKADKERAAKEAKASEQKKQKEEQKANKQKQKEEKAAEKQRQKEEKNRSKSAYSTDGDNWFEAEVQEIRESSDGGKTVHVKAAESFVTDTASSWTTVPSRESNVYVTGWDWVQRTYYDQY